MTVPSSGHLLPSGVKTRSRKRRFMRSLTSPDSIPTPGYHGRLIPKAAVPVSPVLSSEAFSWRSSPSTVSILDAGKVCFVESGRSAIALALYNLLPGQEVLVPAYHCLSMIEPLIMANLKPVLYRIHEDLSIDIQDIYDKCNQVTGAIIVVHYFGFIQGNIHSLRELCDNKGILLLEDCAHCFFGQYDGRPVGARGDYAVASVKKFFPVGSGGCLVQGGSGFDLSLRRPPILEELRQMWNILDDALYYDRFGGIQIANGVEAFGKVMKGLRRIDMKKTDVLELSQGQQTPPRAVMAMSLGSRRLLRLINRERIVRRRREHYEYLLGCLCGVPGIRPLFSQLPDGVVPYVFPLWVDDLSRQFPALEDAAVPMQRFGQFLWGSNEPPVCSVSRSYSQNVLQLPCHQELERLEIEWVVNRLFDVLSL